MAETVQQPSYLLWTEAILKKNQTMLSFIADIESTFFVSFFAFDNI